MAIIKTRNGKFKEGRALANLNSAMGWQPIYANQISDLIARRDAEKNSPNANEYNSPYKRAKSDLADKRAQVRENDKKLLTALLACHNSATHNKRGAGKTELAQMKIADLLKNGGAYLELRKAVIFMQKARNSHDDSYNTAHSYFGADRELYDSNFAKLAQAEIVFDRALAMIKPHLAHCVNLAKGRGR